MRNNLRQVATLAAEYSQVSGQVQESLELIRQCRHDLQLLVQLRTQHAASLATRAGTIERIDCVILAAQAALEKASKLVENCRPEVHKGRTPFRNKLKWVMADHHDFHNQRPALGRHHDAVLAELKFVREAALTPVHTHQEQSNEYRADSVRKTTPLEDKIKPPQIFEDYTLLKGLMEDVSGSLDIARGSATKLPVQTNLTNSSMIEVTCVGLGSTDYALSQQALVEADKEKSAIRPIMGEVHSSPRHTPPVLAMSTRVYCDEKEVVPVGHYRDLSTERIVLSSRDSSGLSVLFDSDAGPSMPSTPYLSEPRPHSASLFTVSQVSLAPAERGAAKEFSIIRGRADGD